MTAPIQRLGIRGRAVLAMSLIVLLVGGGVAAAIIYTSGSWIYTVARQQAGDEFLREAQQLHGSRYLPRSQLSKQLHPATTVIVDDMRVTRGTVRADEVPTGFRAANQKNLQLHSEPSGPNRVLLGTRVVMQTGTGEPVSVELYTIRPLLGIKDKILTTTKVVLLALGAGLIVAALLAYAAAGVLVRPLRRLDAAAEQAADGNNDIRLTETGVPELAELTGKFNAMMDTHEDALEQSRRFTADVAHELRTPLAAMIPAAEVLRDERDTLSPDVQVASDLLVDEAHNLTRLVENLVAISAMDGGRAELVTEETDIPDLVDSVLRHRDWIGDVQVRHRGSRTAVADPRRMEVVIANLVGNALKHGRPPVRVEVDLSDTRLLLAVSNHGPAIPEPVQRHMFDRFFKSDSARSRTAGSGLGLALVAENAHLHGGTVAATSDDLLTVFTVTIPCPVETSAGRRPRE